MQVCASPREYRGCTFLGNDGYSNYNMTYDLQLIIYSCNYSIIIAILYYTSCIYIYISHSTGLDSLILQQLLFIRLRQHREEARAAREEDEIIV